MIVQICVGSSCHLKGSYDIVKLFENKVKTMGLGTEIALAGCFCTGKCNREGVTVVVDGVIYTGLTKEKFDNFFNENVLSKIKEE